MLHELAREIRGFEKGRAKKMTIAQYKAMFSHWEAASKPFLRIGHDYFIDLLTKLDCVTVPKGETLKAAFERAKRKEPPAKVSLSHNKGLRSLASLCRELQSMAGDEPIMLHQESVAGLFGHTHWHNISNWIKALKTLGVLRLASASIQKVRAARYFYFE